MRPRKVLILAVTAAALFSIRVAAQSLISEVVWSTPEKTNALFVPTAVLERGVDRAPLSEPDRAGLEMRIEAAAGSNRCSSLQLAHTWDVPPNQRRTLIQTIAQARTLFTARVAAAVPGWSAWTFEPVMLIWIEPESVLHDADGVVGDTKLLAFQVADAELNLGGARLCSKAAGMIVPRPGDRVLVDARERLGDGRMLVVNHYFPILNGDVRHQPFADVVPFAPFPFERAKAEAAGVKR